MQSNILSVRLDEYGRRKISRCVRLGDQRACRKCMIEPALTGRGVRDCCGHSSRRKSKQAASVPSSRLHASIKLESQPDTEPGAPAAPPQQKPQVPGVRPGCSKQTDMNCMTLVSVATSESTAFLKDT